MSEITPLADQEMAKRNAAWEKIEAEYENSVAHKIARFALGWSYDQLPGDVVHMAKRTLLDAIGCGIGGQSAPGSAVCEQTVTEFGGNPEATIIGSGHKTSVLNAAMVNAFMVRYLDYNDLGGGGHNSDAIPALLATAENENSNGKDFLTALVLSYELGQRWMDAVRTGDDYADYKRLSESGWCMDVRGGLNMPPSLGLLMGLDEKQIAGAIGATVVRSLPMNHLDANDEEFVMSKNLRFGFVAYDAIMSCRLARNGFTGPLRGVEGEAGYFQAVLRNQGKLEKFYEPSEDYLIMHNSFKPLCTNYTTQSGIQSTIALCKENDIKPEDVESVKILACQREAVHTTYDAKKNPRNGESADHSTHFGNALAIIERNFGPNSFKREKFTDPMVLELTARISIEANPEWGGFVNTGGSIITLKNGQVFEKVMENPHGHFTDPLSDKELEIKFREMAEAKMPKSQVDEVIEMIWNCDKLENMSELTELLVFK